MVIIVLIRYSPVLIYMWLSLDIGFSHPRVKEDSFKLRKQCKHRIDRKIQYCILEIF